MLFCAKKGLRVLTIEQRGDVQLAFELLKDWDYSFDNMSTPASIFAVWEYAIGYFLHETTISSAKIRMSITNNSPGFSFVMKSIKEWAEAFRNNNTRVDEPYCHLIQLGSTNDCLDFMAWTLAKGIEQLRALRGDLKVDKLTGITNWRYGLLAS
jgi:hypothetical protein